MKKIGFIDYYLDEWHANNYPDFIKEKGGREFQVCYAYGKAQAPEGKMTNREWAEKYQVELLDNIEELTEKSDYIIVLAPSYPELHEELTRIPLKSQKPVYVDKTFAPDTEAAKRIFNYANVNHTKIFSSSALRFASELKNFDKSNIHTIYSQGPGTYEMYSIHQIEPIVCLMNAKAKRVMYLGDPIHPQMIIEFADGRRATMRQSDWEPFVITTVDEKNKYQSETIESNYFGLFIGELLNFFKTGDVKVDQQQTVDVIGIRNAGLEAMKKPFKWVAVL